MNEIKNSLSVSQQDESLVLVDTLLQKSRHSQPLSAMVHLRVKHRLYRSLSQPRVLQTRWIRRVVVAALLLFCGTAFGIVIDRYVSRWRAVSNPLPVSPSEKVHAHTRRPPKRANLPDENIPALQTETVSLPSEARPSMPHIQPDHPKVVPTAPKKQAVVTREIHPLEADNPSTMRQPYLSESALLAKAVRALKVDQNPVVTLAALDRYLIQHPNGRLLFEANVLRVDALLKLNQGDEALRYFDHLDLTRLPDGVERSLKRGELRFQHQRWPDALSDFNWVLSHAFEDAFIERALRGRIQCHIHLGNKPDAWADANKYLQRFPTGPFAESARLIHPSNPR